MPSPWSPGSGTTPDASRLIIERAREEFVLGNDTDARVGDVRGVVRESWRRSRDGRVGVEGLPPLALSAEELELLRAQHPLGSVMDMIRGLLIPGAAEESGDRGITQSSSAACVSINTVSNARRDGCGAPRSVQGRISRPGRRTKYPDRNRRH